ncbi:acyltransferase family protein [Kitasatospora gansuensis]
MTDLITLSRATAAPPPPRLRTAPAAGFRADLEGLRGVAVLAVLGFHAGVPALTGGYVGVDVFFVLSGFLITGLLTGQRPLGFREFCARRARRILPAAAVVLTATAVAGGCCSTRCAAPTWPATCSRRPDSSPTGGSPGSTPTTWRPPAIRAPCCTSGRSAWRTSSTCSGAPSCCSPPGGADSPCCC